MCGGGPALQFQNRVLKKSFCFLYVSSLLKIVLHFRQSGNKRFAQVLALREELETKLEAWRKQVSGVKGLP